MLQLPRQQLHALVSSRKALRRLLQACMMIFQLEKPCQPAFVSIDSNRLSDTLVAVPQLHLLTPLTIGERVQFRSGQRPEWTTPPVILGGQGTMLSWRASPALIAVLSTSLNLGPCPSSSLAFLMAAMASCARSVSPPVPPPLKLPAERLVPFAKTVCKCSLQACKTGAQTTRLLYARPFVWQQSA